MRAIDFICDYLRNRKQSSNIDNAYSHGKTYYMEFLKDQFLGHFF